MRTAALLLIAISSWSLPVQGAARPMVDGGCRGGIFPMLAAGHFSGSLDCRHDRLQIKKVGEVRAADRVFQVYDYRYSLAPICRVCAIHGGQRIIIISEGRYIGQYKPTNVRVAVARNVLTFSPIAEATPDLALATSVRFSPRGPPRAIFVAGEVLEFFR